MDSVRKFANLEVQAASWAVWGRVAQWGRGGAAQFGGAGGG